MGDWLSDASNSNKLKQTYVLGFVDISGGNLNLRNGRMSVNGDGSFNSNIYVGRDIVGYQNLYVLGDVSLNSRFFLTGDASLNSNVKIGRNFYVANDVSLNGGLFLSGDASLNSTLEVGSRLYVASDVSLNGGLFLSGDASLNSNLKVGSRMYVASDVSMNGGLFLSGDASLNSNLKVGNSVSVYGSVNSVGGFSENGVFLNATYAKLSGSTFVNDVIINGNLNATTLYENGYPVSINRDAIGIASSTPNATYSFSQINAGDIYYISSGSAVNYYGNVVLPSSNNEKIYTYLLNAQTIGSRAFNLKTTTGNFEPWGVSTFVLQPGSNALLKGRTDGGWNLIGGNYDSARLTAYNNTFTGITTFLADTSMNSNLKVGSRMYVASDVSLNGKLFLSGDASFNGNLVMSGNLYTTDSGEGWLGYSGNSRLANNNTETQLGANTNMRFYTGTTSATMGTERMTLLQNGNVGIGKATPLYTFDVNGNINATTLYENGFPVTFNTPITQLASSTLNGTYAFSTVTTGSVYYFYKSGSNYYGNVTLPNSPNNQSWFYIVNAQTSGTSNSFTLKTVGSPAKNFEPAGSTSIIIEPGTNILLKGYSGGEWVIIGGNYNSARLNIENTFTTTQVFSSTSGDELHSIKSNTGGTGYIFMNDGILGVWNSSAFNWRIDYSGNLTTSGNVGIGTAMETVPSYKLDVNGTSRFQSRMYVASDVSLNGKLFLSGDASLNSNLKVGRRLYVASDVSLNGGLFLSGDASLNSNLKVGSRMYVASDVSMNGGLFLSGDASLNSNLKVGSRMYVASDVSMNGGLFLSGDASLNSNLKVGSRLYVASDVSLNGGLFLSGDASLNINLKVGSRMYVGSDVSLNGGLFLSGDASLNSNLKVGSRLYVASDVSMNGGLFLSGDASLNSNLKVGRRLYVASDVSMNGGLFLSGDASLNSNLKVGSRLYVASDVSLNGGLFLSGDASLNSNLKVGSRMYVASDVSLNGKLFLSGDASLNSNLKVGSRMYVASDVSLNGGLFLSGDASLNSNLKVGSRMYVSNDVSLNGGLFLSGDASLNSNLKVGRRLYVASDVSLNGGLFLSGDASLNSNLKVGSRMYVASDVSLNGKLFLSGDASFNGNIVMSGNLYTTDSGEGWLGYSGNSRLANNNTETQLGANTNMRFYTGTTSATMGNEKMTLLQNGNVGIGTSTPAYVFDINGTSRFQSPPVMSGANITAASIPDAALTSNIPKLNVANTFTAFQIIPTIFFNSASHYIKYAVSVPQGSGTLPVDGIEIAGYAGGVLTAGPPGAVVPVLKWATGAVNVYGSLDVSGNIRATGTSTAASFNATSDRRLKTNIEPLSSQWNNIKLLQPAQYKWIHTSKSDHGFIAQDVYRLYPDMRTQFGLDPSNIEFPTDYSGNPLYYTLDYSKMTPYLWKGLQEAIQTIESQQKQIDALTEKVDALVAASLSSTP